MNNAVRSDAGLTLSLDTLDASKSNLCRMEEIK